ncbi:MAG: hypothetical protein LBD72_01385 [Puniceicoccales bacterium]|jgi:hypothetical protein|nr:hypothetical protein [Puniceicoccales bacterium]
MIQISDVAELPNAAVTPVPGPAQPAAGAPAPRPVPVKLKAGAADRVAIMSCGVDGVSSVFVVKSERYIPMLEQIVRKETNGCEATIRRVTADSGLTVSYRVPSLPAPMWCGVLSQVANGGVATGFAAFCTLLGFLSAQLVGFAIPGQGIFLTAVATVVGLLFGGSAWWIGRRYGPQLALQQRMSM